LTEQRVSRAASRRAVQGHKGKMLPPLVVGYLHLEPHAGLTLDQRLRLRTRRAARPAREARIAGRGWPANGGGTPRAACGRKRLHQSIVSCSSRKNACLRKGTLGHRLMRSFMVKRPRGRDTHPCALTPRPVQSTTLFCTMFWTIRAGRLSRSGVRRIRVFTERCPESLTCGGNRIQTGHGLGTMNNLPTGAGGLERIIRHHNARCDCRETHDEYSCY